MTFYTDMTHVDIEEPTIVTIGSFDGLHVGHEHIFDRLKSLGKTQQLKTVVITFLPHPAEVLSNINIGLLTTPDEKRLLMASKGIDYFIIMPFTKELSQIEYTDFVKNILIEKLNMSYLLVGYDHALGKDRKGTFNNLQKLADTCTFGISRVEPLIKNDLTVSSTAIRKALIEGFVSDVKPLLGRNYSIMGTVEDGDKRGRLLGYPTANIAIENKKKIVPKAGVYFVEVEWANTTYFGMCNIGRNPTFGGEKIKIEVHLFDFNRNIYQEILKISFLERLRDELKFKGQDDLKRQLANDEKLCRLFINN